MDSLRSGIAAARRTPRAVRNRPVVLAAVGAGLLTSRLRTLVVRTRAGVSLRWPNRPKSLPTPWEVVVDDWYRLAWFPRGGPAVMHVLDVGAQLWTFALQTAELCQASTVDCYEPSLATLGFLHANAAANFPDSIVVHAQVVTGEPGTVKLSGCYRLATKLGGRWLFSQGSRTELNPSMPSTWRA